MIENYVRAGLGPARPRVSPYLGRIALDSIAFRDRLVSDPLFIVTPSKARG